MRKKLRHIVLIIVLLPCVFSCSEYNKVKKGTDLEKKYELGINYYEKGNYENASSLFEELIAVYRGTARAEKVNYYYAYSNYYLGDYLVASYHFRNFTKTFPNSEHAEECAFMNAYCYYLLSPPYSLDQGDTRTAIKELQAFINQYPKSSRIPECNEIIDKLRAKLELKSYENAKLYYNTGDYKAAMFAFNNTLKEFPDTKHKEELNFLIIKANYLLAINSIEEKKAERLKNTLDAYLKFIDTFPKSEYLKEAESIYANVLKIKENYKPKL